MLTTAQQKKCDAIVGRYAGACRKYSNWALSTVKSPPDRTQVAQWLLEIKRNHGRNEAQAFGLYLSWIGSYPAYGSARSKRFWAKVKLVDYRPQV